MFLNVGGAVLGVAVLTVISDSVTLNYGGKSNPVANLEGYRAGYYGALAMIAIGFILSIFFYQKEQQERAPPQEGENQEGENQEGENQEGENQDEEEQEGKYQEGKVHGSKDDEKKKTESDEVPIASTDTSTSAMASEEESKDHSKS